MVRPVPAGRRGSCCTPYSRLQEEIDNVETIAVTANNTANNAAQTAQQALTRDTFDDVNVNGDLNVYGDIIQQGAAYETHTQHVFSTDDYIVMRDGALVGLAQGDYSGFQVKKYDGTNDGRLVIDKDGTARVGDVGDEQPLLTRDESADMTDAAPLVWDAANSKAISGVFPVSDPGVASINGIAPDANNDFTIEAGSNITITSGSNKITIAAAGGGGGTWTHRTASNVWTDLFAIEDGRMYVLKDTYMVYSRNSDNMEICCFLPKGASHPYSSFHIPLNAGVNTVTNGIKITQYLLVNSTNYLSGANLTMVSTAITFTTDGSTVTVSLTEQNDNFGKYNIDIYTRN